MKKRPTSNRTYYMPPMFAAALKRLSEADGKTASGTLRQLVYEEAKNRGMWTTDLLAAVEKLMTVEGVRDGMH